MSFGVKGKAALPPAVQAQTSPEWESSGGDKLKWILLPQTFAAGEGDHF